MSVDAIETGSRGVELAGINVTPNPSERKTLNLGIVRFVKETDLDRDRLIKRSFKMSNFLDDFLAEHEDSSWYLRYLSWRENSKFEKLQTSSLRWRPSFVLGWILNPFD